MPERIQRRRVKGWRKPAGAVIVDRTTSWGNPFRVVRARFRKGGPLDMWAVTWAGQTLDRFDDRRDALADAVDRFRLAVTEQRARTVYAPTLKQIRDNLAGKDLVCWCGPDDPCHADVLLELANGGDRG